MIPTLHYRQHDYFFSFAFPPGDESFISSFPFPEHTNTERWCWKSSPPEGGDLSRCCTSDITTPTMSHISSSLVETLPCAFNHAFFDLDFRGQARARLDPRFKHFNLVRFWIPRHPEFARSFVLTKAREITSLLSYHTHFWDPISSWIAASPYGATHSTEWYHAIVVLHYALELWIGATSTTMKTEMLETKLQILPSLWQHRGS